MKQVLLSIVFAVACISIQSQTVSDQSKQFIKDFYRQQYSSAERFVYMKGMHVNECADMIKAVQKTDTLRAWPSFGSKPIAGDYLVLTDAEKQFISNEIQKQVDTVFWNSVNIPHSLAVSRDSVAAIFKDKQRGWDHFHAVYGRRMNRFMIPVLIRNGQLCIFYHDHTCDWLCGEGYFAVYKREKDGWVRWLTFYEWVS